MALIASLQLRHPGIRMRELEARCGIKARRLQRINAGQGQLKFMEQVMLEDLLSDETVAKLHELWCNTHKPTFWERHLSEGEQHARRK